jgi:hypothetical protein
MARFVRARAIDTTLLSRSGSTGGVVGSPRMSFSSMAWTNQSGGGAIPLYRHTLRGKRLAPLGCSMPPPSAKRCSACDTGTCFRGSLAFLASFPSLESCLKNIGLARSRILVLIRRCCRTLRSSRRSYRSCMRASFSGSI